jgi:outer membrane protein OmpA-like peptidoglycan-associated protein
MKKTQLTLLIVVFALQSFAQASYYVNIGAFKNSSNADRLVEKSKLQGYESEQAFNADKQLFYVYVLTTTDKRKAYALAVKLRAETEYKDAWVYEGNLGSKPVVKFEPIVTPPAEEKKPEPIVEKPVVIEPAVDSTKIVKTESQPLPPVEEKPKPKGKPFYFKLRNTYDNTEIKSGEVHVQEGIRAPQYRAYKPGEIVYLEAPVNKRGAYTIVTQVAGYGAASTVFNFQNPQGEKGPEGETIVEIPMVKAKKGDYVDFTNVRFYKNAAFMYAPSQNELDGLVDLLKENIRYEIKIHGHVNGDQPREAFTMGPNSSFFAPTPSADITNKNMSAKDLSLKRAEAVRDYLVSQGIGAKRISVKGEGGKIPLYPEGGTLGQYNDRVEIEFTKGK